jgi:Leucine-rich repeat (LRR) protein
LKVLPKEFSNLKNLEALYLNDETEMDLPASLKVLAKLQNLNRYFRE